MLWYCIPWLLCTTSASDCYICHGRCEEWRFSYLRNYSKVLFDVGWLVNILTAIDIYAKIDYAILEWTLDDLEFIEWIAWIWLRGRHWFHSNLAGIVLERIIKTKSKRLEWIDGEIGLVTHLVWWANLTLLILIYLISTVDRWEDASFLLSTT